MMEFLPALFCGISLFLKSENKISSRPCLETPHHCTLVEVISVNGNGGMIMHGEEKYQSSLSIFYACSNSQHGNISFPPPPTPTRNHKKKSEGKGFITVLGKELKFYYIKMSMT